MTETFRLTSLSHGAACACKLPLSALEELMSTVGQGLGGDLVARGLRPALVGRIVPGPAGRIRVRHQAPPG
jgi:hypothetical protein